MRAVVYEETNTNGYHIAPESYQLIADSIEHVVEYCHGAAKAGGWWRNGIENRNKGELLALIHSEISEALEGVRKDKMDEHLLHHKSVTVELADAIIRICDMAGALQLPLGEALAEKLMYNQKREDHKLHHRDGPGGKKF
jgi:NTP pyrophosphatase (non-canonical NTP hydrolase)